MAGKSAQKVIGINELAIERVPVTIVGTTPLIVHAWSEKARQAGAMAMGTSRRLWAPEDDAALRLMASKRVPKWVMCEQLGRSPSAIDARLWKMRRHEDGGRRDG